MNKELSVFELIAKVVKGWKTVLTTTLLAVVMSLSYLILVSKPHYSANASFMLKGEGDSSEGKAFGAFGMGVFGGGGSELTPLEFRLKDPNFNMAFIEKYELLPVLFPNLWDTVSQGWSETTQLDSIIPDSYDGSKVFGKKLVSKIDSKNSVITLTTKMQSPELSQSLIKMYLEFLDSVLVDKKHFEAKLRIRHLEKEFGEVISLAIKERLRGLIVKQYEQISLFANSSIDILIEPIKPKKPSGPRKVLILIASFLLGLFLGIVVVILKNYIIDNGAKIYREVVN
jgi:hypothetical protein